MENECIFFTCRGENYYLNKYIFHDKKELLTFVNGNPTEITFRVSDAFVDMPGLQKLLPCGICCVKYNRMIYFELNPSMENDIVRYCRSRFTIECIRQRPTYQVKKYRDADLLFNFYNSSKSLLKLWLVWDAICELAPCAVFCLGPFCKICL